jgi:hypothetical protein
MPTTVLGFTVGIAADARALREACALRALAYGHHVPALGQALAEPDATDRAPGSAVLVCRDKASGEVVGTARIQRDHPQPLPIEASVILPSALDGQTRAEITRLAVRPGGDALLRPMLFKACWLYAVAGQIQTLVIGARSAALIRIYRGLGFADLLGEGVQVPLAHAGGLPHSVLVFDVTAAERTWFAARHGLYDFMVRTWHPDLQLLPAPGPPALRRPPAPFKRLRLAPDRVPAAGRRRARPAPTQPM